MALAAIALVLTLGAACVSPNPAQEKVQVRNVWSRPGKGAGASATGGMSGSDRTTQGMGASHGTPGAPGMASGMNTGAVYFQVVNPSNQADRLVSARTEVAEVAEIHETRMEGDVMKMQPVAGGVEIPARGQVEFKPGGFHIMLIGLKHDLQVDDKFTLQLTFERSGTVDVESEVRQP